MEVDDSRRDIFPEVINVADAQHGDRIQLIARIVPFEPRSRTIDLMRKETRHRRNESVLLSAIRSTPPPSTEAQLILHEQQALLRRAIEELGEPYREIFKMLIYQELSLADIARQRNLNPGSIYTQYARGVERLREILGRGA